MRYAIVFLISLSIIAGCSSRPHVNEPYRGPATITDIKLLEDPTTLKAIADVQAGLVKGSPTLESNVQRRVSQIVAGVARGYLLMKDFDAQLDAADKKGSQNFKLEENSVYLKLQAARNLIEILEMRIVTVYAHVWKIRLGMVPEASTPVAMENARKLLDSFHKQIGTYVNDERVVAVLRLSGHLQLISESLMADISSGQADADKTLYANLNGLISRIHQNESRVNGVDYNVFINAMGKLKDAEIEKALQNVKAPKRAPNSEFKNVNGNGFPEKTWVLTFDDGPHKDHTRSIAKILKDNSIKAEFFWLFKNVNTYQTIAKEIFDDGHVISSHSVDHANLPKLSEAAIKNQVSGSRDVITQVLAGKGAGTYKMTNFRCPYGAGVLPPKSQKVMNAIAEADLTHIAWNVDSLDWQDKNAASVVERVIKQMKAQKKGVILFHDIQATTVSALPSLINHSHVTSNGIKFTQM